jgi:hypothetical protein
MALSLNAVEWNRILQMAAALLGWVADVTCRDLACVLLGPQQPRLTSPLALVPNDNYYCLITMN